MEMPFAKKTSQVATPELPTVVVLATGGTIAGAGPVGRATNYRPGQLDVNAVVNMAAGARDLAHVRTSQICNVNSDDITAAHWLELARTINTMAHDPVVSGFVITHGTDTLDETAYFLNLAVKTDKPVVLTGAMRPATATSPDGPNNLLQSIALAGNPQARGRGVMVVFSDGIFGGRDVRKISTYQTDAFSASDFGCMGYMIDGVPHFYNASSKAHTTATEFDLMSLRALPPVAVAYFSVDADPGVLDYHVRAGARGIVIAGAGSGCYSRAWNERVCALRETGIPIVRSSRIGAGMITHDDSYGGNLITGNDLPPQKAAVLLRLALTRTCDPARIQEMFDKY
ncbi:MAG: asparaginase [Coriobacteriales bacterium]|nr:asparaginase [Coriobacteriales bacterium]